MIDNLEYMYRSLYIHILMLSYKITSPTDARNDFFKLLDLVVKNHQVYIINRRDSENVAGNC